MSTQIQADNLIGIILTFDITKTTQPDGASQAVIDNVKAVPVVMHYDAGFSNARVYLFGDYTDELAAAHGCHANNAVFTRAYIEQVLRENISEEYFAFRVIQSCSAFIEQETVCAGGGTLQKSFRFQISAQAGR